VGLDLVIEALRGVGLRAEAASKDVPADLVVAGPSGRSVLVSVLAAAAPHHRGGRGSLGLHWMLRDTAADFIALVDLSRERGWLIPAADFRARAQPLSDGRFHLDWIVVPLGSMRPDGRPQTGARPGPSGRTPVPDEEEFAPYAYERALPELVRRLG
jgi:hypothetical protein